MSQSAVTQSLIFTREESERKHRARILIAWILSFAFVGVFLAYGFDYYTLAWKDRPFSPKHMLLRPSGPVGVNLGVFGVLLFFLIYLYPLRKRWGWLGRQGNSRHWLDFQFFWAPSPRWSLRCIPPSNSAASPEWPSGS